MVKIKDYIEVTKPRSVLLLVFTALAAAFVAIKSYPVGSWTLAITTIALILGTGGTNALTCYIDRDIDAKMARTKNRPIPSGRIEPKKALIYSLILIFIGTALVYFLHPLAALFMLLGVADSALVYNAIAKRRSPLNIILGAPAGGMPVFVAWSAIAGKVELVPVMMALLIIFWTPIHIWSLALYFSDDYKKVRVPMLPIVTGHETTIRWIALFALALVVFSFFLIPSFGKIYLTVSIAIGIVIVILSIRLLFKPTKKMSWQLFKFSSPYLFLIFLAMILDYWI
ncbi:MAG TPA: protoheme IX farnesyltransferase [Actinobacteria bacterium]|nr:protoheme IX farnesyltransferase [Actinomycetota bacterium]